jgi:hypothetical protein
MTSALAYKEFREILGIAALGLAALLLVALTSMGFSPLPGLLPGPKPGRIPFVHDDFSQQFAIAAGLLAIALGLWQSLGDFRGDAQLFLLHRPVPWRTIYATKLLAGLAAYLASGMAAILLYAIWAATPGTHASPFEWTMTAPVWKLWFALTALYLGALLTGIRPAAWLGTRLAPLAAALAAVFFSFAPLPLGLGPAIILAVDIALATAIFHVIAVRDFA